MKYVVSVVCLLLSSLAIGQVTLLPKQMSTAYKGVVYKKEWSIDLRMHTNGWAVAYNSAKIKTYYQTNYYHFEFGSIKDPRERRQNKNIPFAGPQGRTIIPRSFTFGKSNSVYILRGGIGRKKYLSEKAQKKGVALGYHYEIGPSIAILKPYFLELFYPSAEGNNEIELRTEKYSESNADIFTNENDIFGGAGFFHGITETTFVPGLQAKGGLHFALGAFDQKVRALEVGCMVDVYAKKIPILVETEEVSNKPYFINLYLNLQFGKRSIK